MEHKSVIYYFRDDGGLWILGNIENLFGFVNVTNVDMSPRYITKTVGASLVACKRDGQQPYESKDMVGVLKYSKILNERMAQRYFTKIDPDGLFSRMWYLAFFCLWIAGGMFLLLIKLPFHVSIIMAFLYTGSLLFALDKIVKYLVYGNNK